jgi:ATP-binding cassette, subfamily F, member 3
MIRIDNLYIQRGGHVLFEDASIFIPEHYKVGIVGLNGSGKSTLFALMQGLLESDQGDISISSNVRVGWIRQEGPDLTLSPLEYVLKSHTRLQHWLRVAEDPCHESYHEAQDHLRFLEAHKAEFKASVLLKGLGFKDEVLRTPLAHFSGGWRMRASMASVLFQEPDLLLLDEPTNHLDLEASLWLEDFLKKSKQTLILISHERAFLDNVVDHILHVQHHKLRLYTGTYSTFLKTRELEEETHSATFEKIEAQKAHLQKFVDRFGAKASKARQAQSRAKAIEKLDVVQEKFVIKPHEKGLARIVWEEPDKLLSPIIKVDKGGLGYGEDALVLKDINFELPFEYRLALLGSNGQGKSTLAKFLAGVLPQREGTFFKHPKLRIGYFAQYQTDLLHLDKTPLQHLMDANPAVTEQKNRAFLGRFLLSKRHVETKVEKLSGGEKVRLVFALIALSKPHLMILDEPTNHLDIDAREALIKSIQDFKGGVIVISHDAYFLDQIVQEYWLISEGKINKFEGNLEDYKRKLLAETNGIAEESSQNNLGSSGPVKKKVNLYQLQQQQKTLAKDLKKFIARKEKVDQELSDSDLYFSNPEHAKNLNLELNQLNKSIEEIEEKWIEIENQMNT